MKLRQAAPREAQLNALVSILVVYDFLQLGVIALFRLGGKD